MIRIIERWWNMLGIHVYLRITPNEYERTLQRITNLIDRKEFKTAKELVEASYRVWGCDNELLRLDTLLGFITEDD